MRLLRELAGAGADDDGGQGRRLRPRHAAESAAAPRARPAPSGSASRPSTRRSPLRDGRRHRADAVLAGGARRGLRRGHRADVDVTAYSVAELDEIADAGRAHRRAGPRSSSRSTPGCPAAARRCADWPTGRGAARGRGARALAGHRHLVALRLQRRARPPRQRRPGGRPSARRSAIADDAGLQPEVRHLANSAAAILRPSARFDLVRCGIAVVRPRPGARRHAPDLGLVPAMTVARHARDGQADRGRRRRLLRPHLDRRPRHHRRPGARSGTATGVPRHAGNTRRGAGSTAQRRPIRGRVCMDQFVVDLGGDAARARRPRSCCSAPATDGEPTAQDWAEACGTINYEIVTRIGGRMARRYVDTEEDTRVSAAPPRRSASPPARLGLAAAGTAVGVARRAAGRSRAAARATSRRSGRCAPRRSRSSPTTAYPCTSRSTSTDRPTPGTRRSADDARR